MTFKTAGLSLSALLLKPTAIGIKGSSMMPYGSSKGRAGICSSFAFKVVHTKTAYFKTGPKNDIFKWL